VITFDCDRLDFVHREEDRREVIHRLREYLNLPEG
jgi:hypothetical protein